MADQMRLALQRIDGVDHVVPFRKIEFGRCRRIVDLLPDIQLDGGIDLAQPRGERLDLDLTDRLRGGHQLTVHVGHADPV